jgi:hypothetical protein
MVLMWSHQRFSVPKVINRLKSFIRLVQILQKIFGLVGKNELGFLHIINYSKQGFFLRSLQLFRRRPLLKVVEVVWNSWKIFILSWKKFDIEYTKNAYTKSHNSFIWYFLIERLICLQDRLTDLKLYDNKVFM